MPSRHSIPVAGLGTTVIPMSTTGLFAIVVKIQIPTLSEGATADSSVVCTIVQNSTTLYTSNAGDMGAKTYARITGGDTISITLSSSNPIDIGPNAVKATIAIG